MADLVSQGNQAFVNEDYALALDLYGRAIAADPSSIELYISRSTTHCKLGQFTHALTDAASAIKHAKGPKGSRALLAKAQFRRGVALVELGKMDKAADALAEAGKLGLSKPESPLNSQWRKYSELAGMAPPKAETAASKDEADPEPRAPLIAPSGEPALESAVSKEDTPSQAIAQPAPFMAPAKIRREWFQNDNFVTISIFIKDVPKDDPNAVKIEYQPRSLSVTIKLPSGSDYMLELEPLFSEIIPQECKHQVLAPKIEIKMKKATVGVKWNDLESSGDNGDPLQQIAAASAPPAYPSSSKKKHDWDALVKSHEDEKPEGEAALHALFKTIYKDASDDTRRAMIKSYQESGGTVLSTNWDEIGKAPVKVSPPDGMEAKKFEI